MQIAIDARMVKRGSMHGIARYVLHLLKSLKDLGRDHNIFIIMSHNSPLSAESWPSNMHPLYTTAEWISFREQWVLPRLLRELRLDLFHAPSFVAPIYCPTRLIMTIHDLNHIVLAKFYTPLHQVYYHTFVRRCINRSSRILTVSKFSKDEIVRNYQIDPQKVAVTYNGVDTNYRPVTDKVYCQYVREIYSLPERFILCVSNNKPHKNLRQLVQAYCQTNTHLPLVLACPVDAELIRITEKYLKKHLLYFTQFIEEEHLPAVYSMAEVFVYPSTYEGFGLPPLEALACKTPVIVARTSALPEVVANHALFVDPYDSKDIAQKLEAILDNPRLQAQLREYGHVYSQHFSWEAMTRKTLKVYEQSFENEVKP